MRKGFFINFIDALIFLAVYIFASLSVGIIVLFYPSFPLVNLLLISYGIILFVFFLIFAIRRESFFSYVGNRRTNVFDMLIALSLGVIFNYLTELIIFNLPIPDSWMKIFEKVNEEMFASGNTIVILICVALLAPIIEELVFRGTLFTALKQSLGGFFAIFITSVIFAAIHAGGPIQMIYAFVLGIILGILRLRTNAIIIPILCHLAYNMSSVITRDNRFFETLPEYVLPILSVILFLIIIRKRDKMHV